MFASVHRVLLAASVGAMLAACAGDSAPADVNVPDRAPPALPDSEVDLEIGDVIAEIDGMPIGANEFALLANRNRKRGAPITDEERREILDDLLNQKALYLEARRLGLDRDPKVQAQMIQILLRRTVYNQVRSNDFTDADLRAYYEAHLDDFVVPEKARVRRLFVKGQPVRSMADAELMARNAAKEINGDIESFAKVAYEVSEGPMRSRSGDMGLISRAGRAGIPQEVVDTAFELQPGQISEPFEAGEGWNIVALMFKRDKVERTFEQMKGAVLRRAKAERQKQLYDETIARLRKDAKVEINEEAVSAVPVRSTPRLNAVDGLLDPAARVHPDPDSVKVVTPAPPSGEK